MRRNGPRTSSTGKCSGETTPLMIKFSLARPSLKAYSRRYGPCMCVGMWATQCGQAVARLGIIGV